MIADTEGRIVYANPAIEHHVGIPAADLIGQHYVIALPEGETASTYDSVSQAVNAGHAWAGIRKIRTTDGFHVLVDLVVSPIRDASGAVTHVLSIGRGVRPSEPPG